MWPFKTLDEKIFALEDKIAGKKARLAVIEQLSVRFTAVPHYWVTEQTDLAYDTAVLSKRCDRLTKQRDFINKSITKF